MTNQEKLQASLLNQYVRAEDARKTLADAEKQIDQLRHILAGVQMQEPADEPRMTATEVVNNQSPS